MDAGIIYYSMTGRNKKLAQLVSEKLGVEAVEVKETKQRKVMTVAWDLMFNRIPKVTPSADVIDKWDTVVFFAPVWMGAAATPLRRYLKYIKQTGKDYMFISLSGGADESNPNLLSSITKQSGNKPKLLLDMHVAEVVEGEVNREVTQSYKLSDEQYEMFAQRAAEGIKKALG